MIGQVLVGTLFVALLIAVALAWMRFRAFARRMAVRMAAAAEQAKGALLEGSDADAIASTRPTVGLAAIRAHDPAFDEHEFLAGVEGNLVRLMGAVSERSADKLRPLVADGLFATYSRVVSAPGPAVPRMNADRIQFTDVRIVGAHSDARYDTITVRIAPIIEGSLVHRKGKARPIFEAQLTDLVYQRSSRAAHLQSAGLFAQRCPNCQAPLDVDLDGCCMHCRADVMAGAFDWVLTRHDDAGAGVGPPPSEQELMDVRAVVAGTTPAAPARPAAQLQLAETVEVNETGRVTREQHHMIVGRARRALREGLWQMTASLTRVLMCAAAAVGLYRLLSTNDDPWRRTATLGGRTITLPLLHVLPVALGGIAALLLVRSLIIVVARLRRWTRAHGGARTVDGRVAFADGAYRVDCDAVRGHLVPWHGGGSAVTGIAPGPCRVSLGPGDELLSLRPTGNESSMLAVLREALRATTVTTGAALEQSRRQVEGGDATVTVLEGYMTAHREPDVDRGWFSLHGRTMPVTAAAVAAVVAGVWYRVYVRSGESMLLAVEPLPAERATSTTVDPDALTGGVDAIRAHDCLFDETAFLGRVGTTFAAVQNAWCRLDPSVSRGVMSDTLWRAHARLIEDRRSRGNRPVVEGLRVAAITIRAAERTAEWDTLVVRLAASAAEYDVATNAEGHSRIVRGDHTVRPWEEDWVFHRAASATTPVQGGTLAQRCPNCQAPIQVDELGICAWCHVPVMTGAVDWVVTRIDRVAAAAPPRSQAVPA